MEIEAVVNRLEALVEKVDLDINYVIQRIANEFSETFGHDIQDETNPVRLTERLQNVRTEFENLQREAKHVETEQKEMANSLCSTLRKPMGKVDQIRTECGLETSQHSDKLIALLNEHLYHRDTEKAEYPPSKHVTEPLRSKTPAELRTESGDFIPVTAEEFEDLSELQRGRAKLDDVNKVYSALHQHFIKKPKSFLSVKDMSQMGLKISGATGNSKLKILRTLNIIKVNKQGSVKMC